MKLRRVLGCHLCSLVVPAGVPARMASWGRSAALPTLLLSCCPVVLQRMEGVAGVEIDPEGRFKYILVRVWREGGEAATLVRGTAKAEFHPDILAQVNLKLIWLQVSFPSLQLFPTGSTPGGP